MVWNFFNTLNHFEFFCFITEKWKMHKPILRKAFILKIPLNSPVVIVFSQVFLRAGLQNVRTKQTKAQSKTLKLNSFAIKFDTLTWTVDVEKQWLSFRCFFLGLFLLIKLITCIWNEAHLMHTLSFSWNENCKEFNYVSTNRVISISYGSIQLVEGFPVFFFSFFFSQFLSSFDHRPKNSSQCFALKTGA